MTLALALPLSLSAIEARADGTFCDYAPITSAPSSTHFLCADVGTGAQTSTGKPSAPTIIRPDAIGVVAVSAAQASAGSGIFGGVSDGVSTAEFGSLHAYAHALVTAPMPTTASTPAAYINTRADAVLYDSGILASKTQPVGTPVSVSLTLTMDGTFIDSTPADYVGEGDTQLFLDDSRTGVVIPEGAAGSVDRANPFYTRTFKLDGFEIGDTLSFEYQLSVQTGATNARPGFEESYVDVSHTASLFLDVLTPEASFDAASGHDYGTAATTVPAVPEPSTWALMASGLAWLATRRRGARVHDDHAGSTPRRPRT